MTMRQKRVSEPRVTALSARAPADDLTIESLSKKISSAPLSEVCSDLTRLRNRLTLPSLTAEQHTCYHEQLVTMVVEKINSFIREAVLQEEKEVVVDVGVFLYESIKNKITVDLVKSRYLVTKRTIK